MLFFLTNFRKQIDVKKIAWKLIQAKISKNKVSISRNKLKKKFNPIQDGLFRGCSRMGKGPKKLPFPKIFHTYPKMMKLGTLLPYLKKISKMYKSNNTPLEFWWYQYCFIGSQQILLYQKMQIQTVFWYIILTFFESCKFFLTNMVKMLMMLAKMATLSLSKIKVFWNKGYGVLIFVYDVINKN